MTHQRVARASGLALAGGVASGTHALFYGVGEGLDIACGVVV